MVLREDSKAQDHVSQQTVSDLERVISVIRYVIYLGNLDPDLN